MNTPKKSDDNVYPKSLAPVPTAIPLKSLIVLAMTDSDVRACQVPELGGRDGAKFTLEPRQNEG